MLITLVSALLPGWTQLSHTHPQKLRRGFPASSIDANQSIHLHLQLRTSGLSSKPSPTVASTSWLQSLLQALEQEEYGTDTSALSFASTTMSEEPNNTGDQLAPLNLSFRELFQKVRQFLSIPNQSAEEDYKLN